MGCLFLSGGGNEKQSKKLDQLLVSLIPKKRLLYIPIAMPQDRHSFEECFNWITNTFAGLNFKKIDMWTDLSCKNYEDLNKYGAVYIGGGNTFSLLNDIRKNNFDKLLIKYFKNGGTIYGGSAGAAILGKEIGTAFFGKDSDENLVKLKRLDGFNLVNNYSIACHYTINDDKNIFGYVNKHNIEVISLPESTGLFVKNSKIKIVGYENAYLFTKKDKITLKVNSIL